MEIHWIRRLTWMNNVPNHLPFSDVSLVISRVLLKTFTAKSWAELNVTAFSFNSCFKIETAAWNLRQTRVPLGSPFHVITDVTNCLPLNCCQCKWPSIHRSCHLDRIDTADSRSACPSPCTEWTRRMDACRRIACTLVWCHTSTRPIARRALARHSLFDIVERLHGARLWVRLHRMLCQQLNRPCRWKEMSSLSCQPGQSMHKHRAGLTHSICRFSQRIWPHPATCWCSFVRRPRECHLELRFLCMFQHERWPPWRIPPDRGDLRWKKDYF